MPPIEPPDTHFLSAAIGWIELGNFAEAKSELKSISPGAARNPDVLEVWWLVHAAEEDWVAGLKVARALIETDPARASGWLHRAYALRRVGGGGLQAAWDALLPAVEKFPKEPVIAYNLSCYACQMHRLHDAWQWLKTALKVGGKEKVKAMALRDADLEPLWVDIEKL